jgi:hypothetical protein
MRRVFSIATVAALLFSLMSPMMAACTGTGKAVSCHAAEATHCDRAMHHHHEAAEPESNAGLFAVDNPARCPMDCCMPGHPQSGTVRAAAPILPPLAVSDRTPHVVQVAFISAGFSSHSDRGPPAA